MKKSVLVAVLIFGLSSAITAQKKGDVEFGFNVGYNVSTASNSQITLDR